MAASDQIKDTTEIAKWGHLIPAHYDYVSCAQTSGTVETYLFKQGGVSGAVVATLVVTYSDASHDTFVSAART